MRHINKPLASRFWEKNFECGSDQVARDADVFVPTMSPKCRSVSLRMCALGSVGSAVVFQGQPFFVVSQKGTRSLITKCGSREMKLDKSGAFSERPVCLLPHS